jgi:HPt (histidine-containing phosphotransfer) domain-containing protein
MRFSINGCRPLSKTGCPKPSWLEAVERRWQSACGRLPISIWPRACLSPGEKPIFWRHLLISFARVHGDDPAAIRRLLADGNLVALERLAHALKGSLATIGVVSVSALAAELQQAARTGDAAACAGLAERCADSLTNFIAEVHAALDDWDKVGG